MTYSVQCLAKQHCCVHHPPPVFGPKQDVNVDNNNKTKTTKHKRGQTAPLTSKGPFWISPGFVILPIFISLLPPNYLWTLSLGTTVSRQIIKFTVPVPSFLHGGTDWSGGVVHFHTWLSFARGLFEWVYLYYDETSTTTTTTMAPVWRISVVSG